jgi:multidrug efflux pump subunit AcrB
LITGFQEKLWPRLMNLYERTLWYVLRGKRPQRILLFVIGLFFFTIVLFGIKKPAVVFFPDNMPNNVYVMLNLPVGTDQKVTDSLTRIAEEKVYSVLGKNNPIVESIITNVTLGAGEGGAFDRSAATNKGKVTINFVEYKYRNGVSTTEYLDKIREAVKGMAGAEVTVVKNKMGPPTGAPVNIEISGENLDEIVYTAGSFKRYLDSIQIPGVEELKSDFLNNKPEIIIDVDRIRANREGISTGQIGMEIRNAVYGKEISKYKEAEDEFPIMLRYSEVQRGNINTLLNLKITYRDMNSGLLRQIPLSSVASVQYKDTYGGIKRKNFKRVITISSDVLTGYTANDIVNKIKTEATAFPHPRSVDIKLTGEQEDQTEAMSFLSKAMMIALGLIFFILITQFNSLSKSIIILSEVIFSVIGVLLGIIIFGMSVSVIMTGLGIVALGGIVVRNGILIVEFTDVLRAQGMKTKKAIVQAGRTRITPVVLTATATILGLVPLAVGMNINFITMFTELNPQLHFGGDNVMFWGNLSWTIIFGLSFATFLTLVFVPAMYLMAHKFKIRVKRGISNRTYRRAMRAA